MNLAEFREKIKQIEADYLLAKRRAVSDYVMANNPHKKGDVVSDRIGSIIITAIGLYISYTAPCAYYRGIIINKNGKPNKRGETRVIYQANLI